MNSPNEPGVAAVPAPLVRQVEGPLAGDMVTFRRFRAEISALDERVRAGDVTVEILDAPIVLRIEGNDGEVHAAALTGMIVDAGCTDVPALVLDASEEPEEDYTGELTLARPRPTFARRLLRSGEAIGLAGILAGAIFANTPLPIGCLALCGLFWLARRWTYRD